MPSLGYENPVLTSEETYYLSLAEPRRLLLYKILGFHGSEYEECRVLGYENSVPASQETYNISAIETSRLMICMI
jgi:hypothetical protein